MNDKPSTSLRFKWTEAIKRSDLPAATRQILNALSRYMSTMGDSCFPRQETLALDTGLSKRTVVKHINIAIKAGWLIKVKRIAMSDKRWKRNSYIATFPQAGLSPPKSYSQGGEYNVAGSVVKEQNQVNKVPTNNSYLKPTGLNEGVVSFFEGGLLKGLKPTVGYPTEIQNDFEERGILKSSLEK